MHNLSNKLSCDLLVDRDIRRWKTPQLNLIP